MEHFSRAFAYDEIGTKSGEVGRASNARLGRGNREPWKVLNKGGAWLDLWFRRLPAARELSEWERETGGRETPREAGPCLLERF